MTKKCKTLPNGRSVPKQAPSLILRHDMIKSPQFQSLSSSTVKVLIGLCCHHNGYNNRKIYCSHDQLKDALHLGKATVGKALKELEIKGFIVCTKKGYFTGRQASLWEITFLKSEGYDPTNRWKNPNEVFHEKRNNLTRINSDFLSGMAMEISKSKVPNSNIKLNNGSIVEPLD